MKSPFFPLVCALALPLIITPHLAAEEEEDGQTRPSTNLSDMTDLLRQLTSRVDIRSLGGAEIIDFQKGIMRYRDSVTIDYEGMRILADGADFNRTTGDLAVRGNVSIYREGMLYRGESAVFNVRTNVITSDNLRSSLLADEREIFFQTEDLRGVAGGDPSEKIGTRNTFFTTHDSSHPNWSIRANSVDIFPEDRVVFRNMTVYAGGTPVFWLPYLSQPLDRELGYSFTPGYDSVFGAYLLNRYGTLLGENAHTLATYRFDIRSERGLAGGVDLRSTRHRSNPNYGLLRLYYANDQDPGTSRTGRTRVDPPDSSRYRASLQQRFYFQGYEDAFDLGEDGTLRPRPVDDTFFLDANLDLLSDEHVLEDFYPGEFRTNPQPDNTLNLVKTHPFGSLSLMGRFRVNDFFQSDTRLPEIALDTVRVPVLGSPVFYESTSSFGIIDEKPASGLSQRNSARVRSLREDLEAFESDSDFNAINPDFDPDATRDLLDQLQFGLAERGFNRFDTYHQVSVPVTLFGWLNLVPRGGVRYTNYSSVTGLTDQGGDRALVHGGLDASVKFSREYDGVASRALGLDGLRHIIQPYTRYSIVTGDELDPLFPVIDRISPTTRPRPIDLGRWTAIDSLGEWNLVRLGTAQRWQTRRDNGTHTWLELDTYIDSYIDDPEFDRDFSNFYMDAAWNPLPWVSFNLGAQFDVMGEEQGFNEYNTGIRWMPTPDLDLSLSHRYLDSHPFLQNSNRIDYRAFYRLKDEWGFSLYHRWELDDNTLETQQYSIHRDLVSWTAALGTVFRDNRGRDEFGVVFTMTLKEFPQFSVPIDLDPSGVAQ